MYSYEDLNDEEKRQDHVRSLIASVAPAKGHCEACGHDLSAARAHARTCRFATRISRYVPPRRENTV